MKKGDLVNKIFVDVESRVSPKTTHAVLEILEKFLIHHFNNDKPRLTEDEFDDLITLVAINLLANRLLSRLLSSDMDIALLQASALMERLSDSFMQCMKVSDVFKENRSVPH